MKASDYIAHFLREQQTEYVFEVAGGMITHILDSIYQLGKTNIISVHHEQAAAFAAEGYGRKTGRPGIALATSGPGATNLLTGIASCYFDSTPALFITGQVNTHEQKGERLIRQLGFQETDIISMAKPITKACFKISCKNELVSTLEEAYATAINDRPGPVLIDIPMNIQSSEIDVAQITYMGNQSHRSSALIDDIDHMFKAIIDAKKPLILAGNGIACAQAKAEFRDFVDSVKVPVVASLLGLDSMPYDHALRVGMIGSYGNRWANLAIGEADLLIVIGSRLDIRQTGADVNGFRLSKIIYHVDCDANEVNNRVKGCIPVLCDVKEFLNAACRRAQNYSFKLRMDWLRNIVSLKKQWPDTDELKGCIGINPNSFMHELSKSYYESHAYFADVGNHQMWAAQSLQLSKEQSFITSGGMGAMGFALPAAIGYSLAAGKKPVVVIVGDGCFQFNIQELQTIVRNKIPLKMVIINNQALGMIRQFQDSYFQGRYQSTYWGYSSPNFTAIAAAYGIQSKTICKSTEIRVACEWLSNTAEAPALLEVMVSPYTNVYPKIAFGKPITEMEPFVSPIAMEGT